MKRILLLLLALLLLTATCAAEETGFAPLPWTTQNSPNKPLADCFLPDAAGYHDDSLDIRVETIRRLETNVMVVRIKLYDASQLRTDTVGRCAPWKVEAIVPAMSKRDNAVLATNGDFFGFHQEGIVWRNGAELRHRPTDTRDTLIYDANGDLHVIQNTTEEKWQDFVASCESPVIHTFTFGPALVVDGKANEHAKESTLDIACEMSTQRLAIGQVGPLEYVMVATEGPENKGSVGFTIDEMTKLMEELGCSVAYNLDGGSSSTVVLNHRKINALTSSKIRPVADCIWFATLVSGK